MMDRLVTLLREKSAELNLFSAGDRLKLEEKHVPDAQAVLAFWKIASGNRVMDLGTGGGIPGLFLAASRPDLNFTLVDATNKKIKAVLEVAEAARLTNVAGLCGRFETLAHDEGQREQFDVVTARAVAELPVLLEYVSGFLKVGGRFYAWKSMDYAEELALSKKAQDLLQLCFVKAHDYDLPSGEARSILEFEKMDRLSDAYPRKDGIPKAKPLQ